MNLNHGVSTAQSTGSASSRNQTPSLRLPFQRIRFGRVRHVKIARILRASRHCHCRYLALVAKLSNVTGDQPGKLLSRVRLLCHVRRSISRRCPSSRPRSSSPPHSQSRVAVEPKRPTIRLALDNAKLTLRPRVLEQPQPVRDRRDPLRASQEEPSFAFSAVLLVAAMWMTSSSK